MSEKINTKELVRSMATHLGVSAAASTAFIEAFQEVFEEALLRDKVVKVNDIGTFKLVWHAPRKSVNVRSGEEMEIAGHYKISFVPDNSWGDKINEPLAHLEAVELPGDAPVVAAVAEELDHEMVDATAADQDYELPMQHLNEQATEVKSLLDDILGVAAETEGGDAVSQTVESKDETETQKTAEALQTESVEEQTVVEVAEPQTEIVESDSEEPIVAESADNVEPIVETAAAEMESEPVAAEPKETVTESVQPLETEISDAAEVQPAALVDTPAEEQSTVEAEEQPVAADSIVETEEKADEPQPVVAAEPQPVEQKSEASTPVVAAPRARRRWIGWLVGCLVVVALLGACGYLYLTQPELFAFLKPSQEELTAVVEEPVVVDTVKVEEPVEVVYDSTYFFPPEMGHEVLDKPRKYDVFVATRTVTPEDRLVTLAQQYYGHKFFWVYIFEANQDVLSHPNKLLVGQQIRIPKLADELIDVNDSACLDYVKRLGDFYVKR